MEAQGFTGPPMLELSFFFQGEVSQFKIQKIEISKKKEKGDPGKSSIVIMIF